MSRRTLLFVDKQIQKISWTILLLHFSNYFRFYVEKIDYKDKRTDKTENEKLIY